MHIILVSAGSSGDVYPFIGLGAKLRARGHRCTLVANECFGAAAAEHGLGFSMLVSDAETSELLLGNPGLFWSQIQGPRIIARWGTVFLRRQYELLDELASEEDAVLVAHHGFFAARLVQERSSRPLVSILLQPWVIKSASAPPIVSKGLVVPRRTPQSAVRLYFRGIDAFGDLMLGGPLNRLRKSLGLKPIRRIFRWWLSPQLAIGLFPEWYSPPQPDWPPQLRLAGFPMFDGSAEAGLPADVEEFCRAGEPPIAFTFGTGMRYPKRLFHESVEACRILGARGILVAREASYVPAPLPPSVFHCRFAPFQQLFRSCRAVVYHGGIGTGAKALAAGVPQLVVPFNFDQPDNASRMKRLGVGDWINPSRFTGHRVAKALAGVMQTGIQSRCRTVAELFEGTDALELAADLVESATRDHSTIR